EAGMDRKLRSRLGASDLVQETLLEAHRDLEQFRGATEREFVSWLRQILANSLRRAVEQHVFAVKRDVRRDISLDGVQRGAADSSTGLDLPGRDETPSACCERNERSLLLLSLLEELSPGHRDVLTLRNLRGMSFKDVARLMERSVPATKMLWMRAMEQLRQAMRREES
ncbi:MAG: sigma-70 family RNA polymerase sigma factor, partial [Planctomycetales bacterium]|nr:sigma-70 family RNA polymerase sigma factor [Planctomycetales bacterium]